MSMTKWIICVVAVIAIVVGWSLPAQAQVVPTSIGKFAWAIGDASGTFCQQFVLEATEARGFYDLHGFYDFGPCGQPHRKMPLHGVAYFLPDGTIRMALTVHIYFYPEAPIYALEGYLADLSPVTISGPVRNVSGFLGTLTFLGSVP